MSRSKEGPDRTVKQHQEQISPNHMQALFLGPVQYVQIEYVLHFIKKVLCSSDFRHYTIS